MSRLGVTLVASLVVIALAAPGAGAHDGVETAAGHASEDAVTHTAAQERALDDHTRAVTAFAASAAAAATAGAPQDVGEWGPVVDWPVVGVHVALLPDGKVLAYDSIGDNATETYPVHDHTRATVWDPATGIQTPVNVDTGFNVFCSGLAHLLDGRLFLAGGNKDAQLNGIVQTHIFDPADYTWSLGPNMASGRWYPSVTPLPNGEMLITSGRVNTPEVRTLAGGLRALSTASLGLPLYPWMDVAPDGRAFYSGPDQTLRALDTARHRRLADARAARHDQPRLRRPRDLRHREDARRGRRSLDEGRAGRRRQRGLAAGLDDGADGVRTPAAQPDRARRRLGPRDGRQLVRRRARRPQRRRLRGRAVEPRHRAVADAGRDADHAPVPLDRAPAARRARAVLRRRDLRHVRPGRLSRQERGGLLAALPLPGRRHARAAPRDRLPRRPSASYGAPIEIATGDPASIRKVALVRLGADTHSVNMEQRYIPLSFTAGATSLTATAPANANVAPPGPYMLFIVNAERRAVRRSHGQRPGGQLAADRHAHAAGERRDVHGPRHGESGGDGVRRRRHGREGRVLQRRGEARRGHDRALQLHLERRGGRDVHRHGACHRQPRREHDERTGRRSPSRAANTAADRERSPRRPTARSSPGSRRSRSRRPRAIPTAPSRGSSSATARRCSARTRARRTPTRGGTSRPGATS